MIVLKTVIPFSNNFFFINNDKGIFLVYLQNKTKFKPKANNVYPHQQDL